MFSSKTEYIITISKGQILPKISPENVMTPEAEAIVLGFNHTVKNAFFFSSCPACGRFGVQILIATSIHVIRCYVKRLAKGLNVTGS